MVRKVGEAALSGLLDRRGIKNELDHCKYEDPEMWEEIVSETGRAAIEAMRDLTPQMQTAARDAINFDAGNSAMRYSTAAHAYMAVIDAALKEGER